MQQNGVTPILMSGADAHEHTNRLIEETSPYLLQHAHNPVDWYPWGPEALAKAKEEDKPILLSIGYAACHWCHVMERESFENEDTARLMNEHFVNIKIDREERPDIDEIYMSATVAMTGSGGWPMTVFVTPDEQQPFYAGTYFPPRDMSGRPGFPTLLRRIAELWEGERAALLTQAGELTSELRSRAKPALRRAVSESALDAAAEQMSRAFDPTYGGFGKAPKFPPSMALELLLRQHRRTGHEMSLAMVRGTLDGMAKGGLRDHVGGGFARYSTDDRWLVPHFEKMLYDNALLARVYAHMWQLAGQDEDRRVATETLDYVLREMTSPQGAFYSATDADSEGEEGKFFVWSPDEVEAILPPDEANAFCAYYDVTADGNWEGKSIANTPRSPAAVADELGMDLGALEALLASARDKLYRARKERVPPLLDDKILTSWNGLMIGTMAEGGRIFDDARYRDAAARAADFVLATMKRPDGGLFRTTRAGKTHLKAYLQDYAYLCDALIDVYEAGCGRAYLEHALRLAERLVADFHDAEAGGFFNTASEHEALLVRMREGQDGPIPAGNAIAAKALTRLSWHFGREDLRKLAVESVRAHGQLIQRAPRAFASSLCVADMLMEGPVEAVLVGPPEATGDLARALGRRYLPNMVLIRHDPKGEGGVAPPELLAGKELIDGAAALYLCRDFACKRPLTDALELEAVLDDDHRTALDARVARLGERLDGAASPEGTARYVARFDEAGFNALGKTGLMASRIGFGGYRVDDTTPAHRAALRKALTRGCNLIDTSTNYTDGGSERMIGSVVAELVAAGELQRDEVIVVSKIGYVQGQNLASARQQTADGAPFADMVEYSDDCWHCIHPDWLEDQLTRSLDRLGLSKLDVCLLHNPEYFLSHARSQGEVTSAERDEFYARIQRAFVWLEQQVHTGRIGSYGVSSNSVAQLIDDEPEATELTRMLAAAREAGGAKHHFSVLQLPLNLVESAAALAPVVAGPGMEGDKTVLAHAAAHGLGVLVNRPLNALVGHGVFRLADVPATRAPSADSSLAELVAAVDELEKRFAQELAPQVEGHGGKPLPNMFNWAEQIGGLAGQLQSIEQFEHIAQGQIIPRVSRALGAVERGLTTAARGEWSSWRNSYIRAVEGALTALRSQVAARSRARAEAVSRALEPHVPAARLSSTLSQKAIWALASTPGVSVVLLGMRREDYVDDALPVASWPRLREPGALYAALAALQMV
jgi:uncharacterized protein YyaL (SSP411 family)/aryl-alcohol dehydrogenase-like predicted oxidoreductase